jgi:hypothetical protein
MISLGLSSPSLLILPILLGEAVQSGQLLDGIAESRVVVIIRTPWFARMLDPPSEILLEMFEPKNAAVNEARGQKPSSPEFQSLMPSMAMALCQPTQT